MIAIAKKCDKIYVIKKGEYNDEIRRNNTRNK